MYVFMKNGRCYRFENGYCWEITKGGTFIVQARRKKAIGWFRMEEVAGWAYTNEDVTSYGITDKIEPLD